MSTLFGRVYQLDVAFADGTPIRTFDGFGVNPLQIRFMIDQTPNAERSYGEITLFGLNPASRRRIYEEGQRVTLAAGYRDAWGEVFSGTIENAEIGREETDTFVRMYCQSGVEEWKGARVFQTFAAGTPQSEIIRTVAESFGFPVEIVGDFSNVPSAIKGRTFARDSRSAMRELSRSFGFEWAVLNDRLWVVKNEALLQGDPLRYTPTTGLIGAPEINAQFGVDIDVLLNPRIRPWDTYVVESQTAGLTFNGIYYQPQEYPATNGESLNQVVSLQHEGDLYGDTWQTSIEGRGLTRG